jgi:hypothetical protein
MIHYSPPPTVCDDYIQDGPILWYGPAPGFTLAAVVDDFGFIRPISWDSFLSAWDVFIASPPH